MALPINISDLITGKTVEWDRIEFKAGWNPEAVLHNICAFANDINNWGGGYIIIGIEENNGQPVLPLKGLFANQIDAIQKELLQLTHTIDPFYSPITEPVEFKEKNIFIIWVPGGSERPYKVPSSLSAKSQKQYYIRRGSSTVHANHTEIKQLMELAAKVPFDDRVNHNASIADLDLGLIREFLQEIKSDLFEQSVNIPFEQLCRQMRIVSGPDENLFPINAGLLFFNNNPDKFFRGAITEIIEFTDDAATEFTERKITGPLHYQIKSVLNFIKNNVIIERVIKVRGKAQANRFYNYPYEGVEEAVVNAYYHRSYEHQHSVEINIHPDKIEILSFPGPLPPVDNNALKQKRIISRDYRNRRIGDFLKELDLTEARGTGIPKIYRELEKNGSPNPVFKMDIDRTSFLVILPIHKSFDGSDMNLIKLSKSEKNILMFCLDKESSIKEIAEFLGAQQNSGTLKRAIPKLIELGLLSYTIPEKPTSNMQRYRVTPKGQEYLSSFS